MDGGTPTGEASAPGILPALVALVALSMPTLVAAQGQPESTDSLIDSFSEDESGATAPDTPLEESGVQSVNLDIGWQAWSDSLDGQPAFDRLTTLRRDATSLGRPNLPGYSLALVQQIRDGSVPDDRASGVFDHAAELSPDLPEPRLAHAWHVLDQEPTRVSTVADQLADGLSVGFSWPDTRTAWELNLSVLGVLAVAAALLVVVMGQIFRQLPITAHDLGRCLPTFVSRNQVLLVVVAVSVATGIWLHSPLVVALLLLAFASWPQRPTERLATALVAATLAVLPTVDHWLIPKASFPDSKAQRLLHAQYLGCDSACRSRLRDELEASPDDALRRYTLALAEIRTGDPDRMQTGVERLRAQNSDEAAGVTAGWTDVLLGAGLVAVGESESALDPLEAAADQLADHPAPVFNLARAHQRLGGDDRASEALSRATDRDVEAVRHKKSTDPEYQDAPHFVMLPALPEPLFLEYHRRFRSDGPSVLGPTWREIAGPYLPLDAAPSLAGSLLAVLLLAFPFQYRGYLSTPCPRCGLAREPDDSRKTGGAPECHPCYRTTTAGADLGYRDRIHYESYLGRRETLQRYLRHAMTLLTPGGGHSLAGHALSGFVLSLTTASAVLMLACPTLVARGSHALFWDDWLGLRIPGGLLGAVVVLIVLLTLRSGVDPWSESDSNSGAP